MVTFGGWRGIADERSVRSPYPAIFAVPVGADISRVEAGQPEAVRVLSTTIEAGRDLRTPVRFRNLERFDVTLEAGADLGGIAAFPNLSDVTIHASRPGFLDLSALAMMDDVLDLDEAA